MSKRLTLIAVALVSPRVSRMRSIRSWTWWPTGSSRSTRVRPASNCGRRKASRSRWKSSASSASCKSDPQMRTAFINKVAAPIANKMFECGMIP